MKMKLAGPALFAQQACQRREHALLSAWLRWRCYACLLCAGAEVQGAVMCACAQMRLVPSGDNVTPAAKRTAVAGMHLFF